jgi:hypothetical protein
MSPKRAGKVQAKAGRRRGKSSASKKRRIRKLPDPASPAFAYLVATRAWRDGLTANVITKDLFQDSSPLHLMQVKRALKRAHSSKILKLIPTTSARLRKQLSTLVNANPAERRIRLHVVKDTVHTAGAPVYAKAAELIADFIRATSAHINKHGSEQRTVICNAGGRTVSETVKALMRNPPILVDSEAETEALQKSLLFVAGNAAYDPEQFHRSANFLSVTMAELFEARHLALPKEDDADIADRHAHLVESTSLFVCGAGTCRTGKVPSLMAQYFGKKGWPLPENAVGDLGFNLLDKNGTGVELPLPESREFMRQLNPSLNLTRLLRIADGKRVLVVLDAREPKEKTAIGTAVLKGRYATDVVLGSRLAAAILKDWKPTT